MMKSEMMSYLIDFDGYEKVKKMYLSLNFEVDIDVAIEDIKEEKLYMYFPHEHDNYAGYVWMLRKNGKLAFCDDFGVYLPGDDQFDVYFEDKIGLEGLENENFEEFFYASWECGQQPDDEDFVAEIRTNYTPKATKAICDMYGAWLADHTE